MSKVLETRIRVGVETSGGEQVAATIGSMATASKSAQAAFEAAENASQQLYAGILEANPEAQRQLGALVDTYSKLRAEMAGFNDATRSTVNTVLTRLERADLLGAASATATPAYNRLPVTAQEHLGQLFQQVNDLNRGGVQVDFDRMVSPLAAGSSTAPTAEAFNRNRYNRLSNRYEGRLDTFETALDGAETDLDTLTPHHVRQLRSRLGQIGSIGRQAHGAGGVEQEGQLAGLDERLAGYSTRLDDLLKQRAERGHRDELSPEDERYQPNFARLFDRRMESIGQGISGDGDPASLERRLGRAAGDLEYHRSSLDEDTYDRFSQALQENTDRLSEVIGPWREGNTEAFRGGFERRLAGLGDDIGGTDPYSTSRSNLLKMRGRLGRAEEDLQEQAGRLEPEVFDELTEAVKDLTDKMGENVRAYNEAERGDPIPEGTAGGDGGGGMLGQAGSLLSMFGRGGMGGLMGGFLGGLAGGALPAVVGLGQQAFGAADRFLTEGNRTGRQAVVANADLARSYGLEGDNWNLFRGAGNFAHEAYRVLGYNARDAERSMAVLDNPGSAEETTEDVYDILRFSRSTGLDEGRVSDAVRTMGLAGTYTPGGAETPLETLKMALTEGVKNGVSQADTMNALVSISQQALAQGRTLSPEALAFNASLLQALGDSGNELLQGEAGAKAASSLLDLVTGGNDPKMQLALSTALDGITPQELGFEGEQAEYFTGLQSTAPQQARTMAMELIRDGRAPQYLPKLGRRWEQLMGNNPAYELQFAQNLPVEQRIAVLSEGMSSYLERAAANTGAYMEGEDLSADVQADNPLAQESAELEARERETKEAASRAQVQTTGQAEVNMRGWARLQAMIRNRLQMGGANDGRDVNATAPGTQQPLPEAPAEAEPSGIVLRGSGSDDDVRPTLKMNLPPNPTAPRPAPSRPRRQPQQNDGATFGNEGYAVMAGGLEGTTPDASNTRTGAFGFSQIMPGNFIGHAGVDGDGLLQHGWDRAFIGTPEGKKWETRFRRQGLNPADPIPDAFAELGRDDPNALPSWFNNLSPENQETVSGFLGDATRYQLGAYHDLARKRGASPLEAQQRAYASWYGGSRWLNRDDPRYALSDDNPAFTTGHGEGDLEPSVKEYLERGGAPAGGPSGKLEVSVSVSGMENIQVSGLKAPAAQKAQQALASFLSAVIEPESHQGFR